MKIKLMIGALIGGVCLAFAAKDPVLMTINGKDIHLSEFEYLYKKNNQQQVEKEMERARGSANRPKGRP